MMEETLIPGIFEKKTNCKIHYMHVTSVFLILILIFIITCITIGMVGQIHSTATQTQMVLNDMNELIPEAKLFLKLRNVMCHDKNFTTFYPAYASALCN